MITMIFDTETTGLIDNRTIKDQQLPEVIELYACVADLTDSSPPVAEINFLIKPRNLPLEPVITKITGIKTADLFDAPSFSEVIGPFDELLSQVNEVIAHNCSFDVEMMDIEHARLGLRVNWPARKVCTVEQSIWYTGKRLSLSALHELLFKEKFEGAHRAKVDVMALLRCAREMYRKGDL